MAKVTIGGQAVMEGVMMKNNDVYAVAVRKPDKAIDVEVTHFVPVSEKCALFRLPLIRGVFNFIESLVIGMKTLMHSADFFENEDGETEEMSGGEIFGTIFISLVIAIGLFMLLPAFLASVIFKNVENHYLIALFEGVIRLVIFLCYIYFISKMEDISRTYMYHGAEHKTINCLEQNLDLTVENVMKQTRFHKRCGTSFLFIVMMVSILVFMFIDTKIMWLKLLLRILLVPLIAGISYEFIRYAGKHENAFANILSQPGLWVQRLTTKEPTPDMVEVAIKSVEAVLDVDDYLREQRGEA